MDQNDSGKLILCFDNLIPVNSIMAGDAKGNEDAY